VELDVQVVDVQPDHLGDARAGAVGAEGEERGAGMNNKFKMLKWFADCVEGTGWLGIVIGVVLIFNSFSSCSQAKGASIEGLISFLIGSIPLAVGELLILCGQTGKCFMAIEENTRDVKGAIHQLGFALHAPPKSASPSGSGSPPAAGGGGNIYDGSF
jgi:hypothetical protein